ncbi:hypothetical protein AK88_02523 [Plasmodium fragile]|uniref:Pv-fam-h protein n=1 Tax=Plasmodium fragile TaxID=5857 RepID=A0A0D9QLV8_PLAFR|nr:uncharacterized protein AK88_02523 [Plasmodium fragile]KJP87767.1 hypothetical protein AK88_02523 [Plasmodium fragile]
MGRVKRTNTEKKKTTLSPILRISLFSFLVWIAKSSNNDGHYGGKNGAQNLGKSWTLRNGRLLSEQPQIEFDTVFNTFKDSFLDKMGLADQEQEQIKDMMHSYFNNLDLSALERQIQQNPDMFQQFGPIPNMLGEIQKDPNKFNPFCPLVPGMPLPPQPGTSASSDGKPEEGTSGSSDLETQPGTSSKKGGAEKPESSSGILGPFPPLPSLEELFGASKPDACGNGESRIPNFNFLEELQKNANLLGEIQKGANGAPGNLRGVEQNKDNNKQDGKQEGNNMAEGTDGVLEEKKKKKNEEATEGGKKMEKKKQVAVGQKKSKVDASDSEDKDEEFEDAMEQVQNMEEPHTLPKFPARKPEMPQPSEQANALPFANLSFPGMPKLDLLFGQQLAKGRETSALASFVNKLNFLGVDAKLSVVTTLLVGLAYYKVEYFVYLMMFITGMNLFREVGSIFGKLLR